MSATITLDELHRFFEDNPDDYRLENEAETRLKALYSCLVNATSTTMLQIGLSGLLTYVKASTRSALIEELLLSKDYISEIITIAADHFTTAPLLSGTCLYECMLIYPKKFSQFLINKFRPLLPRIIYKKTPGPSEICCKCIAHLSVLGIPSNAKQVKAWKNEYDRYLKIASLLIDQLYLGINDPLCPELADIETALTAEIGDVVSPADYASIFCNCCAILRYLFYVKLDSPVTVASDRTYQLISKVVSITSHQLTILHRKQHLPTLLGSCVQLCDTLVTFNPSSFMFKIRSLFGLFISLLDLVRPQAEYLTLSTSIYQLLTNLCALFNRQVRLDVDMLQMLIRWIVHDSMLRTRSKIPVTFLSKADHNLARVAINCTQQLLNVYSDHMPMDQYCLLQNHFVHTLMACQTTHGIINKPYDDETCRVGLYNILECLLINERADCPTIVAISKDLIDNAASSDSSIKVKMAVRKLKLVWQQVHDSTSHLYQPWSFLQVEKPRLTATTNVSTTIPNNELHNVFPPSTSRDPLPIVNNHYQQQQIQPVPPTIVNTDQSSIMLSQSLSKPTVYRSPMEPVASLFLPPPTIPFPSLDLLSKVQQPNLELPVHHLTDENKQVYEQSSPPSGQQRKRAKLVDTRPVAIDVHDDDDGAENIFADGTEREEEDDDEEEEEEENEHMEEDNEIMDADDDDELDESDEVDDDDDLDDEDDTEMISEEEDEHIFHTNGMNERGRHLAIIESNDDMLDIDSLSPPPSSNHKKFRRQHNNFDHHYLAVHHHHPASSSANYSANGNPIHPPIRINGDHHKNIGMEKDRQQILGNGQTLPTADVNDDDDEIVLLSDDSEDKKEAKMIVQSSCGDLARIETAAAASVDNFAASPFTLALQETMESLRDVIDLISDDYAVGTENEHI